jgi:hypothetical protein
MINEWNKDGPTVNEEVPGDEWYEREKAAFIAWWESEGQKKFGETPTLAAGAGWLARAEAVRSETALTDEKGRPMTYWGGAASPDKKHGGSPLTEHEIAVLREEMLSDDGFLPEGKERVARLCDMALASIAPSAVARSTDDAPGKVPPDEFIEAVNSWLNKWPTDHLTWRMGDLYDRIVSAGFVRSARALIIEECAKYVELEARSCRPGSSADDQNWGFCLQSVATKMRRDLSAPPDRTTPNDG